MDAVLLAEDVEGTLSVCRVDTGARYTQAFRGVAGSVPHRGVACLGKDYIVAASKEKAVLHVWTWTKHAQPVLRIPVPGKVSAIACSPCGFFCVCGIDTSIYIWEVASGRLLAVISHHFQTVSALAFTDDGAYLLSGGHDGHVHTWNFSNVLSCSHRGETFEPLYTWTDHQLPVTDIYCGIAGLQARVFTASKDGTCQVYELSQGRCISSLLFESKLSAIALDIFELFLFGAEEKDNIIRKVKFYRTEFFRKQQVSAQEEEEEESDKRNRHVVCHGHTGTVSCLSVTRDGTILLSASDDGTARLWQTSTCQCLHVFNRRGPVSFATFVPVPDVLLTHRPGTHAQSKYLAPIALFQRQLTTTSATSSSVAALETVPLRLHGQVEEHTRWPLQGKQRTDYWKNFLWSCAKVDEKNKRGGGNSEAVKHSSIVKSLQHQQAEMLKVNTQLLKAEAKEVISGMKKS